MDSAANMYTSMEVEYDSDEDVQDVGSELNTWLAQLNMNSKADENMNRQQGKFSKAAGSTGNGTSLLTQSHTVESFRCSVIMDGGNGGDLDDIINDLCALEAELTDAQKEFSNKQPMTDGDSGNVEDLYTPNKPCVPPKPSQSPIQPPPSSIQVIRIPTNPSVPSYSSRPSGFLDAALPTTQPSTTSTMWDRDQVDRRVVSSDNETTDQEQLAKEEKIRLAIQKIQAADIKKLFVKVFVQNGECKTILVDEKMATHDVLLTLFDKCEVKPNVRWTLVEQIPDLYIERIIEDHEKVIQVMMNWLKISNNKILFLETDDKYDLFFQPQNYLLSRDRGEKCPDKERKALLDELFGGSGTQVPELEGEIYHKVEGQKTWKKITAVLRSSGLYARKGKSTKGLHSLAVFDQVEIYRGFGWRKKFKAPTEHCFALKHPKLQKKSKDIKYFCCEDEYTLKKWLMGMRIVKYGKQLHSGFKSMLDVVSGGRKPSTGTIDTPSDSMSQSSRDSGFSVTSDSSNSLDLVNSSVKKKVRGDASPVPPPPPEQFSDLPPPPPELLTEDPTPTNTPVHFAQPSDQFRRINSLDDSSSMCSTHSDSNSSVSSTTPRNSVTTGVATLNKQNSFERCSGIRNSLRKGQLPTPPKQIHPPKVPEKKIRPLPPQPSHHASTAPQHQPQHQSSQYNSHCGHYGRQFAQPLASASSLAVSTPVNGHKSAGHFISELRNIYAKQSPNAASTESDSDLDELPPPPPELLSDSPDPENPYDVPYNQINAVYNETYSVPPPPLEYNPYADRQSACNGYSTNHNQSQSSQPAQQETYSMSRVFASQTGTIKRAPPPPKRSHNTLLKGDHR